jgi:nitrate reductase gamma subunit
LGVDWTEGAAMVFGELMGIVAPLALIGLAGLIIYRICNRTADH